MPSVYRITALWNGFLGSPGYSRFSFGSLTTDTLRNKAGADLRTFFEAIKPNLATTWTIQVQPTVEEFDAATGLLVGAATMTTPPAVTTGTGVAAAYAGGAGACVTWRTSVIFNGRRVRGRTFLVPLLNTAFAVDGTLDPTQLTIIGNAATTLATTNAEFSVWAKLFADGVPPVQNGGAVAPVDSATVKDATSQLRSRRT